MQIEPRKELANLPPTVHGGQAWRLENVEDYSQNLNPLGPPPGMEDLIAKAVSGTGHYPDADCLELRKKIAKHYKIEPENVAMGAGSSEIIRNFPFAFINPGDSVLLPSPSFAEYTQQCKLAGAKIDYLPLSPENDFYIDTDELFGILRSKPYKALYICNPNNPTGRVEGRKKLLEIVKFCEEIGTMVFLDETLLALCADASTTTLIPYVDDFTNLLIAESYTKSFAIPGVRVGYGISNPAIIAELDKVRLPWNVGTVEQAIAGHLIEYEMDYVSDAAFELRKEAATMKAALDDIGFPVGAVCDSFFYFVSLESLGITGKEMVELMLRNGIMVRDCASFGPQFENYIRFCVKDRKRNSRFVDAMEQVLKSLGV